MREQIVKLLEDLGIKYRLVTHPAVFTVAQSMEHIKDKKPIKNLLLQEEKGERKVLIIMAGDEKLDTKLVARLTGVKKIQFAKPEVLEQTLGVKPGAVSLFGLLHPAASNVEVIVDSKLLNEPELGFHPNDNTATIYLPGSTVEKIIQKTGQKYQIAELYEY